MIVIHSEDHRMHFPQGELSGGQFVTPFERPSRVEYVLRQLKAVGLTDIRPPGPLDMEPVRKVHDAGYLDFLANGWGEWIASGMRGEMIATGFAARRMQMKPPKHIDGKLGYYCLAAETAITAGTWQAAQASCSVMQTAFGLVADGQRSAFALCRPPGHHAPSDMFGGYCFLNNAAIAAEMFRAKGAARVAVLDVDFHHGNGTQDIFYDRPDVLFLSLHGEPEEAYPYFLGYADETGAGPGEGFNFNYPMPPGTPYSVWSQALEKALAEIRNYGPDALVISLGVDTYKEDPISFFKLESDDFTDYGRRIAGLGLPTLFVMEGGYAIEAIGVNTVNVLQGFLDA